MRNVLQVISFGFSLSLFALGVPCASAQEVTPSSTFSHGDAQHITCETHIPPLHIFSVSARPTTPYSATEEWSSLQTLADGTHITHQPRTEKVYRDSQGCSRREQSLCGHSSHGDIPDAVFVTIRDPVEGIAYILDLQNHIAYRFTAEARSQTASFESPSAGATERSQGVIASSTSAIASSSSARASISVSGNVRSASPHPPRQGESQPLGTQVIEGLTAEGTRTITTIPVDAEGNDRPIQVISETWFSPDLKMHILTKTTDPRSGENTYRLTDINLSEPDPALFRPPGDFKIVDDAQTVTIQYSR